MSSIFNLTKVLFKSGGGLFQVEGKKQNLKRIGFGILILTSFLPFATGLYYGTRKVYPLLKTIGAEGAILSLLLATISFMIFTFGIFMILNIFYFSSDIEYLLPLPIKPSTILSSKLLVATVYEYLMAIMFYLPVIIGFGIESKAGILFILYSSLVFLILPLIPLIMASLINIIIMRFTNLGSHKEFSKVLGGIFGLAIILGINFYTGKGASNFENPDKLISLLTDKNSLINFTSKVFPLSKYGAISLINSSNLKGLLYLLLFIGITITAFIFFVILGNGLYIKGVIGISEAPSKRAKMTKDKMTKEVISGSPFITYFKKEVRYLFRTSIYFLNCVLMNFLWPVFILIPLLTDKETGSSFNEIRILAGSSKAISIIMLGAFAFMVFISSSNIIASTSISRDGKYFYVNKYIPLSYKTQLLAKVMSGVAISYIGVFMVLIFGTIILKLNISTMLIIILISPIAVLFPNLFGIIIDLLNPKLKWDSEQKAVKQNLNGVISMFGSAAIIGIIIFGLIKLKIQINMVLILIVAITLILDIVLYLILDKKGSVLCDKIV